MARGSRWWAVAGMVVLALGSSACSSSPAGGNSAPRGPFEQPKVLASGLQQPEKLVHDGSALFFLGYAGGGTYDVYRLPDQGGAAKQLATTDQGALGASKGELFLPVAGELDSMPGSGGTPAHYADASYNIVDIAADASGVYWSEADSEGYGNVWVLAAGDTQARELSNATYSPDHIALGDRAVFWVVGGDVYKAPKSGGPEVKLATSPAAVSDGIAVDQDYVYWTALDNLGTVRRVSKDGSGAKILVQGLFSPRSVAVDASYVYFTVQGDGLVERVPKGGGRLERLAVHQNGPDGLALGAGKVFWANFEGGTISSVSIP